MRSQTRPKRSRPCANCRRRKRRCVVELGQNVCVLCKLDNAEDCSFDGPLPERPFKQPKLAMNTENSKSGPTMDAHTEDIPIRTVDGIEDYDTWQGPSLLKKNLGLQQHQFSRLNSFPGPWNPLLLDSLQFDDHDEHKFPSGNSTIRRVSGGTSFFLKKYTGTISRSGEIEQLDDIERVVAPHGLSLVNLYFRIVHPSFPVLDKRTFLEKYERTHREFLPFCLGSVYLLALEWWNYDPVLSAQDKPDVSLLERLVRNALQDVIARPKLSTLQGGLLLLQLRPHADGAWGLCSQLVAMMQDLGVHMDCSDWRIPAWEKNLRRRLAWSLYVLDKWMAMIHGRPSHIFDDLDWTVGPLTMSDFPETPADENQLQGSGDILVGRLTFERLVSLSQIANEILKNFSSAKARQANRNINASLEIAKPIQIKLREWRRNLPESLHPDSARSRKQSSVASLHLAYYATEITLHQAIILTSINSACDSSILKICREAARERVVSGIKFVKSLTSEHIQSFWHFFSGMSLVYIGTFTALLYQTSTSVEEAAVYKSYLDEYVWTVRMTSRAARTFEFAIQHLDLSLLHLDQVTPDEIISRQRQAVENTPRSQPGTGNDHDDPLHMAQSVLDSSLTMGGTVQQEAFLDMLEHIDLAAFHSGEVGSGQAERPPNIDLLGRNWRDVVDDEMAKASDISRTG